MQMSAQHETLSAMAIIGSGAHKFSHISPLIREHGVDTYFVKVDAGLPEVESHSPRVVLEDKLMTFEREGRGMLDWMAGLGYPICTIAVMDVLGLSLGLHGKFGNATKVLKKPDIHNSTHAAAEYFAQMVETPTEDEGYHWSALIDTAGMAPYCTKKHEPNFNKIKAIWYKPLHIGISHQLAKMLASSYNIEQLIDLGLLSGTTFNTRSIGGVKQEKLIADVARLAAAFPHDGLEMAVVYKGEKWKIDGKNDQYMQRLITLVYDIASNSSAGLARQMAEFTQKAAVKN